MSLLNTSIGPERVQVFPVPIGTVQVPGVSTSVTAFLISSTLSSAPVNVPTPITDLNGFVSTFGDYTDVAFGGYYSVEGFYNNGGTGNTAWIVNVGDGVNQVSTVTAVADVSASLNDTYFLLSSANNATNYYVWFNVSSGGTDPMLSNKTGIPVAITTGASADTVASAIATAVALISDFTTSVSTDIVTITNVIGGAATDVADGGAATGFTFATSTAGRSVDANDFIGNSVTGTGLRALDLIDQIGLICCPGLPMSLAYLVQPAVVDYTLVIRSEFGETFSTSFSLLAIPTEVTTSQTSVPKISGLIIQSIASTTITFTTSPNLSAITPGMIVTHSGLYAGTISAVNASAHTITLVSIGSLITTNVINIEVPSAIQWKDSVINTPSEVSAWYYNWLVVPDENQLDPPGSLVTVDPTGHVAGVIARIDANIAIGGPSHAPAGIQFAGIVGIAGLQLSISERSDAGPLRLDFINRITSFPGAGSVIFGGYTNGGNLVTPDEQLIQVIRTLQFIKSSLEQGLVGFLWENFSPDTQQQVERAISDFLRNNIYLFPAGLPESQQFQVIDVVPTQDDLNQGLLQVRVQVRPNTAVRFIEIALEFPIPTS